MNRAITFETGITTCAVEPGKFCRWVGTRPVCTLFLDENGRPRPLQDKDGWLQRHNICIAELGT